MDNKVRKNSIYSLLKAFSQVVFPLITFPYISRVLHAENVGKVNFGNSIISYVSLAASLGITTYAVRECSKIKDDKNKLENMVGQIISLNMVTTFIAYIGLALALLAAKPLENYREMIIILSTTVLFTTLGADWLNTAMEDFKYITVRTFLFQLVSIAAMLLFVRKPEDYMRYAVITVIASSGANITNMVYRRKFCKTKLTLNIDWKRHLPPVLLLFVMVLAQTIYCNSDITILGIIKGNYEVGLYSTSVKIYNLVNSTIASIAWVVMPQMTKNFNEGNYDEINKLFRYAFNFVVILGLPCVVGINIVSGDYRDYCRKRISGSDRFPAYTFHCISNFTYWRTDWKCAAASGNGGKNMSYRMCDFGDGKYYTEYFVYSKVWYYCSGSYDCCFRINITLYCNQQGG